MTASKLDDHAPLVALHDARYANNCWAWLTELVVTIDEATEQERRWPDKLYLRDLFEVLEAEPLVAIPKSRRMMVTWALAAWAVWRARYRPHNAIFIQSETEAKSAYVVDQRCAFIESHLRIPLLRREVVATKTAQSLIGRLKYPSTESYISAVAQGDGVMRSYTPTILIMDECEFQPEAALALQAALPLAEKGAKIVLASTSNGPRGIMADICRSVGFVRAAA